MKTALQESFHSAALLPWAVGGAVAGATALLILLRAGVEPIWDQTFITYHFSHGYPTFDTGIVSHLLVGVVNALLVYDPVLSNAIIRALAALLYMGAAGLLAWSLTGSERLVGFVVFLLLLVSARFPFLWVSSELFAGAFLMLFLWSLVRGHAFAVTGCFLVLFSLSKADLALPGLLVGAYLVLRPGPESRWRRAAVLGGFAAVLVAPALLSTSYYAQFGGRTWVSFGQHYGELVRHHQLGPSPSGWEEWPLYLNRGFPGAGSVWEAAIGYPRRYVHFVSLSSAESVLRLWQSKLLFLVPLAVWLFARMPDSWRVVVLLLLANLLPIVLLSFLHVRYQARLYPLALFVIFAGLRSSATPAWAKRAVMAALALLLLWQAVALVPVLRSAYWLPD